MLTYKLVKYLPFISAVLSIAYLAFLLSKPKIFASNVQSTVEDKSSRETDRGVLMSMFTSTIIILMSSLMYSFNIPKDMVLFNFGFIFSPILGYLFDIGFAKDDGLNKISNPSDWFKYTFEKFSNLTFIKYIITVLLDMFISSPIQDVMSIIMQPLQKSLLRNKNIIGQFTGNTLPSIIQAIVAFATFQAYTNQTRFEWAYKEAPEKDFSTTILLMTAISACVFLIHNIPGALPYSQRIIYTLFAFGLLSGFEAFGKNLKQGSPLIGMIIFLLFFVYGVLIPFSHSKLKFI